MSVHPYTIRNTLNTAFDHVGGPKLLTDLTQVPFRRVLVLHHARAADYLQVRDPGEICQYLILHAGREVGVLFIVTQVFERQDRDAFFRRRRRCPLRLRSCENFLETRIASQRVPFPPQTKVGQCDAIRPIWVTGRAGRGKETLNERDCLVRFAHKCKNQRQISRYLGSLKCVFAFRLQFDCSASFSNGILLPLHVGIE